jgi:integrase/recombinase XerD
MAFPFSVEKTRIDYLILRLETYPQDGGTRPGQALLAYLRHGRPATPCRELFLEHTAPYHPLQTASAITKVVKRLLPKAGIARRSSGAHLFRHTVATQMVRRGASFKAVADVLGHQSLQTTGLYAKLDLAALAQVALPWPGGAQ